ncbi:hypothetical protein OG777_03305 [Micromonospora peucetia]|uniref:DUF3558 domain-containing protein n=1 Tax=Micromonospora peucetia TaxID=47871 RepID=A0A1C6U2E6_9ACTN|nr:hypothetical protein [Micromonospora peucetia]MCX4385953.1 hypothetical protein [Micromonospora peucetia]WSA33323.1 hypothetical protein OIE14_04475 [Micromonospora peucetia]SCL48245.1 hypothetical protein GA0070608_0346 [Micromonospora peucetia]
MRGRIVGAGVAALLAAGCGAEAEPVAVPPPAPVMVDVAAASSGGACRLLDFGVIEQHAGFRFDVAAASRTGDSHTCVVRAGRAALPELTLSVTETSIDAATFTADVVPEKAAKVSGLGQQAYRRTTSAKGALGPVAEVGWLATEGRLATLRYATPRATDNTDAENLTTALIALAKQLDTRTG